MLGPKIISGAKKTGSEKIFDQKKIWFEKILGLKKSLEIDFEFDKI